MTEFSVFEKHDLKFLCQIVGNDNVSVEEAELLIHGVDAYAGKIVKPDVVVWPDSAEQISQIVKYANSRRLPVVPRGAGSSLSGNVVPVKHGIVISFRRMNKILKILDHDMQVVVQPGVVIDDLNSALKSVNLFFPPDPASSSVCTIGGMVANNASGLGAVKYGVTRDYVLKLEVVLPDGKILHIGSNAIKSSTGYDLVGLFVGAEGTLGIVTEITLSLRTLPPSRVTAIAYFNSVSATTQAVSEIMTSGLEPAALEFLDHETIQAVNQSGIVQLKDTAALLLIEFHGDLNSAKNDLQSALKICEKREAETHLAQNESERMKLWKGRKGGYPALLKISPHVIVGDIVVPISKVTEMLSKAYEIAASHNVRLACFGHSGDGNIHPNILADHSDKDLWIRAEKTNEEIVSYGIKLGGVASGEHGIGVEKLQFMELEHGESLPLMRSIKKLMDPNGILNPGKLIP